MPDPTLPIAPPVAAPTGPLSWKLPAPPPVPGEQGTMLDLVRKLSRTYGVPEDMAEWIVNRESGGTHAAGGQVTTGAPTPYGRAKGFFQMLPTTAWGEFGLDPNDEFQNIEGGVRYLAQALEKSGHDPVAAARYYHGGPNVKLHGRRTQDYGQAFQAHLDGLMAAQEKQPPPAPPEVTVRGVQHTPPPTPPDNVTDFLYEGSKILHPIGSALAGIPSLFDENSAIRQKIRAVPGAVADFAKDLWQHPEEKAMQLESGMRDAGQNLIKTQRGLWDQGMAIEQEARQLQEPARSARLTDAAVRQGSAFLPFVGPRIAEAQEFFGQGKPGAGLGAALDVGAQLYTMKGPSGDKMRVVRPMFPETTNALEQSAIRAAQAAGVPVDVAAVSGNRVANALQRGAEMTYFGAGTALDVAKRRAEALQAWANDITGGVSPLRATPLTAGEKVKEATQTYITQKHARANRAYDKLRAIEADPANMRQVQIGTTNAWTPQGTLQTVPIMGPMQLPVDIGAHKPQLQALYDSLTRGMAETKMKASPGLKVLKQIIDGPDFMSASVVDIDLGTLKGLTRTGDAATIKNVKTISQGVTSKAIDALEAAVDQAVAGAGAGSADARRALDAGRQATRAKHEAKKILKTLQGQKGEDVGAFRQLVQPHDASKGFLQEIQRIAPREIPKVASATLQELFDISTQEGGWNRGAGAFKKWKDLGDETKKVLFTPEHKQALDDFFLAVKMLERTTNPSGTALTGFALGSAGLALTNPTVGLPALVGAGAFARLAHSPRGVKLLTEGLHIKAGTARAIAWTAAAERYAREEDDREAKRSAAQKAMTAAPPPRPPVRPVSLSPAPFPETLSRVPPPPAPPR